MKKYILFIAILIIAPIAVFPLLSCGGSGSPAPAAPSPATEAAVTTTPAETAPADVTTPPPATALPPETPPPASSSPSLTVSPTTTAAADLPDLKPYAAITVDTSGTDYKNFSIIAGVTNAGSAAADNVTVELYNGSTKIYTWNFGPLKSGENRVLQATVADILKQYQISAGQYSLNINCIVSGGKDADATNNKSDTFKTMLALPPVAGREPQSAMEKTIRDSIINGTWYTEKNKTELTAILKDVLKNANISWTTFVLELQPFDKYNDLYADTFGETATEKLQIKLSLAASKYPGTSFIYGNTGAVIICIREGTLLQVMPTIMAQLGVIDFSQINYTGYTTGLKVGATKLAASLLESYGIQIMREKYGLSGLTNISATLSSPQASLLTATTSSSTNLWRIWALAANEGYPEGGIPSDKILKAFFSLTSKTDLTAFMDDLDKKVGVMDKKPIQSLLRWRLVNKELTMLPEDTAQKAGTGSLDAVISYQDFVMFP